MNVHRERDLNVGARRAMTLIELLVALGMIGLLISLLLPAVQQSRETARQTSCRSNLRQIGIALPAFETTHRRFPPTLLELGENPPLNRKRTVSPHYHLLSFLDHASLFNSLDLANDTWIVGGEPPSSAAKSDLLTNGSPVFLCPSDRSHPGANSYRACNGTSPGSHGTTEFDPPRASLPGWLSPKGTPAGKVVDGLSNTAFFSEKQIGDQDSSVYSPRRDTVLQARAGPVGFLTPDDAAEGCRISIGAVVSHFSYGGATWLFGGYPHTWYNHVLTPNAPTPDCTDAANFDSNAHGAHTARSAHVGGVFVLMGDGAVRFVSDGVDLAVWRGLATISGREVVSGF